MPAKKRTTEHKRKKTAKENRRERPGAKALAPEEREAIRRMVGDLPQIILEEGYLTLAVPHHEPAAISKTTTLRPLPPENIPEYRPAPETAATQPAPAVRRRVRSPGARSWLWFAVTLSSLAIFGIWIFNLRTFIDDIKRIPSPEDQLLADTKADISAIVGLMRGNDARLEAALDGEKPETKVKNVLKDILAPGTPAPIAD